MGGSQSSSEIKETVNFFINGKTYTVTGENENLESSSLLVDYIRENAGLKGTKYMCREGGCGACVVSVKSKDPVTGEQKIRAVNSCLVPTLSCDGWDISTIESQGNRKTGYSQLQKTLVHFNGSQCGFCTSGMIMNMHSLIQSSSSLTVKEIENNFDGNICRCTGYRPILDAFKTYADDAPEELRRRCADIEDCSFCPMKRKCEHSHGIVTHEETFSTVSSLFLKLKSGEVWVKAISLETVFEALKTFQAEGFKYRVVSGNTGTGVYKNDGPYQAFVDVTNVPELKRSTISEQSFVVGAGCTLANFIAILKQASTEKGFSYAGRISKHVQRIANVPVRNAATIAGNLMLKHGHNEFPSDIFLLLETVAAELVIATSTTETTVVSPKDFLQLGMEHKIILEVKFKPYSEGYSFRSFKITRRYQNAHAYVNAGFLMKIDKSNNYTIVEQPRIVFGGINPTFIHATSTENVLTGRSLKDSATLRTATDSLQREIKPNVNPPDATPEYRKNLTLSLLYKYVLGVLGPDAKTELRSGGRNIKREPKSGQQTFEADKEFFPVGQPFGKLEAAVQTSGEAEYINDIHPKNGELFGAFVISTVANADIHNIDPSEALKLDGVVSFICARDIPGKNNYMVLYDQVEEIFATNSVKHAGQPVGLIVAQNKEIAFKAAKLVKVDYENIRPPVLSINDGIEAAKAQGKYEELVAKVTKSVDGPSEKAAHTVKGEFGMGSQCHFQMETHICICIPNEDGMDVYSATQWMDQVQAAIASTLAIPNNEINMQVRRLGGSYGCKISRGAQTACACAVAAYVTNKPVKVAMDLQTNMEMVGKRPPYLMKYEAGVDDNGKILSLKGQLFCDTGIASNEETSEVGLHYLQSMYSAAGWAISPANISTNTPANTWCRAPGSTPGIAMIENIMEHIAFVVKKDPIQVRLANILSNGQKIMKPFGDGDTFNGENPIPKMLEELKTTGSIENRLQFIKKFNLKATNRWRKRGMALVPMRYPLEYGSSFCLPVYVAIYKTDGTVAVSHGGIECGQGLNTKVAQAVAYAFDIPIGMISVKPSNNLISPNTAATGGSSTSELCCHAALEACQKLKDRMKPIKDKMKKYSWVDLIQLCNKANIDLTASHMPSVLDGVKTYDIWVLNLTEVEIDCLTGEYKVVRIDIIEDAGKSLNPEVDVGQVEGALIMGLGLWTTEKLVYDTTTGRLLTNGTWEYKPPLPKDIPDDLRVTLLRNAPNPYGVLRSKATGEPPLCSSISILFALKNAIYAARQDNGHDEWFQLDGPVTVEDIRQLCLIDATKFDV